MIVCIMLNSHYFITKCDGACIFSSHSQRRAAIYNSVTDNVITAFYVTGSPFKD